MHRLQTALFFLSSMLCFSSTSQVSLDSLQEGLLHWWDMTPALLEPENAFLTDGEFVDGRDGTPNGAVSFLGDEYCYPNCWDENQETESDGMWIPSDHIAAVHFSLSLWVKPNRPITTLIDEATSCGGIASQSANNNWALFPNHGGDDMLGVGVSVGTNGIVVGEHGSFHLTSSLTHPMAIEDYVHVVVVYTNTTVTLYVNGVFVETQGLTCPSTPRFLTRLNDEGNIMRLRFGAGLFSYQFNGIIDQFSFWNRSLSETEAAFLFSLDDDVLPLMDPCIPMSQIGSFCGDGTMWDDLSQTCVVKTPSDSNFDGCVQLNDLLDLLSAYGICSEN